MLNLKINIVKIITIFLTFRRTFDKRKTTSKVCHKTISLDINPLNILKNYLVPSKKQLEDQ